MFDSKMFIGLDLGTTSIKGALLDVDRMRVSKACAIPFPSYKSGLPVGYCEIEPQLVLRAVRKLIQRLLSDSAGCSGILMCSQMHGLVLMNEKREPLSNVITWKDQRALERSGVGQETFFEAMSNIIGESDKLRLGNNLEPNRPLSVLFTQMQKARLGDHQYLLTGAIPASLPDFVAASLCHSSASVTDATNAAAHSAFDCGALDWDWKVIAALGLERLKWPRLGRLGEIVGQYQVGNDLLPCYLPLGDHQCALLGSLLVENELSLNISTGSQVSMISTELELNTDFQSLPYFDDRFLKSVVNVPAGRALDALVRILSELPNARGFQIKDPWTYIEEAVEKTGETNLKMNLAFFPSSCGEIGAIQNISEDRLTVGHLFAAAYNDMVSNYYNCALRLSPAKTWNRLVLSGGLVSKSRALRNLVCKTFDSDYRVPASENDSTLVGLLILASVVNGKFSSTHEAILGFEEPAR